jgi:hypothetical protein
MNLDKFVNNILTGFSRGIGYRASKMLPTWVIVVLVIAAFIFGFKL